MKKRQIFFVVLCILVLCLTACGTPVKPEVELKSDNAQIMTSEKDLSFEKIKHRGSLKIGVLADNEPFSFKDKQGNLAGYDIELAKKTAVVMGLEAEFVEVSSAEALKTDKIDVLWSGCKVDAEMENEALFSVPYITTNHIIVVRANSDITEKEMLEGKTIGIQVGCCSEEFLKEDEVFSKTEKRSILTFYDIPTALAYLKNNQAEALVLDEVLYHYYASSKEDFMILEDKVGQEEYAVAVKPDSKDLVCEIDSAITKLKENKIECDIYDKWFK